MRGVIYTRVSSDEQVKGTSLDFQEEICRNYCKEKGIEVLAVFREEGASAKTVDRAEFLRAIEFCRKNKGKVEAFVVAKVDRFARNTEDHFYVRKTLLDYGVTLHSVSEPIGNSPVGKFFETMLAGSSEFDNAIRRQRCTDGMLSKINQGIYPWKPPLGYKSGHFKRQGLKKVEPDPIDEKTFPIIQRALKEYSKGVFSSQIELAKTLDNWGLAKIRGKKTSSQLVDRLLGKYLKFYAGILINPWTGEKRDGLQTAMITKEELFRIQLIRTGKSLNNTQRNRCNPLFPLRRTGVCASCTRPLTGSVSRGNGGKYAYYHCSNKQCQVFGKGIAKKDLEAAFILYLKQITPKGKFLAIFKETVLDLWQEKGRTFELEADKYQRQLAIFEAKKKRIYDMREDGSYSQEEFLERRGEVENQIIATKISLSEARIEQFDIEGALIYAVNFIRDLGRQWFDLAPQLRPRFQKLLFPEGIPYQRGVGFGTAKLGLIYEINRQCDGDLSQVMDLWRIELQHPGCKPGALPLCYRPTIAVEDSRLLY